MVEAREKDQVNDDKIDQRERESHAVRDLRADHQPGLCANEGCHGKEERCGQGGQFADEVHMEIIPVLLISFTINR